METLKCKTVKMAEGQIFHAEKIHRLQIVPILFGSISYMDRSTASQQSFKVNRMNNNGYIIFVFISF